MTSALKWPSFFFSVLSLFCLRSDGTATSYLGCFYDNYPNPVRLLPLGMITSNVMTIGLCINHCLDLDYPSMRYAGVEGGAFECWCGAAGEPFLPQHGEQPDTACNIPCPGDSSQTCGAEFHIQVYDLSLLTCELPQSIPNGVASSVSGDVPVRMYATFTCNPGYSLDGLTNGLIYLQCIVTNSNVTQWENDLPHCQEISGTRTSIMHTTGGMTSESESRTGTPMLSTNENVHPSEPLLTSESKLGAEIPMSDTTVIIAGSAAGAGFLLIVLVIIVIIVCIRKRNPRTKTGQRHQQESRRANNNNDDQLSTSVTVGQNSDNPLAKNMYDHTPTVQPNNSIPLYAVANQTTPPSVVKTTSKRPTVQAYAYTDCTINSPTMPNGRAINNNDDQVSTSATVGQNSDNPLAENMYDHTPTAQPNNSIPLYAVVNQTTPPPVVKMASKRPTDQAYAYTECTINPPIMPNGDSQPIFADGDVTSGGRDSGWVDNNIYARTDNNGGEEGVDNAAYATVNRNQDTHAAVSDEEKEGWAENSIYVTSS